MIRAQAQLLQRLRFVGRNCTTLALLTCLPVSSTSSMYSPTLTGGMVCAAAVKDRPKPPRDESSR
jgi:hypothetical protein